MQSMRRPAQARGNSPRAASVASLRRASTARYRARKPCPSWLQAFDTARGTTVAQFQTDGSKANAARYIGADGQIDNPKLYSDFTLDAAIVGLERMYTLGPVLSSPVVVDGIVYFGSTGGNVYAVR